MLRLMSGFCDPLDEVSMLWPHYATCRQQRQNVWRNSVDVSGFRAEEIKVDRQKCQDKKEVLVVQANHNENDDFHQMKRSVALPDNIDVDKLQIRLSPNGQHLLIEAPYKKKELSVISDFLNEPLFSKLTNTKIVSDEKGGERFEADFDVRGFKPEEIQIQQTGDQLIVEAKHNSSTDESTSTKEMRRSITIPTGVKVDQFASNLNESDGILRLIAPYSRPEKPAVKSRDIPIQLTQKENQQSIQQSNEQ